MLKVIARENVRFLKQLYKKRKRPVKAGCIKLIGLYQKKLSRHTCLYKPTCSEYTKHAINNWGVFIGIGLGIGRIIRCNPLSKGGTDEAPEVFWKARWLV